MLNDLTNILYEIKEKPGMYIGYKSLTALADFLNGYLYAKREDGIKIDFLPGFNAWIAEKYSIKSSHDWSRIISFFHLSQEVAFDKFYEHLEEFLAEKEASV
ncbi:hypothetical protein [Azotosporobacter soli]|uniref:hypothetical protein n=1 Tax=Azotosporobacter soli TaxID=3055040 RepID=UPI0031FE4F88